MVDVDSPGKYNYHYTNRARKCLGMVNIHKVRDNPSWRDMYRK